MNNCVIAFDFEAFGGTAKYNGFTELGAVLVRVHNSEVLATFHSYASMLGYAMEERCMREFWSKYPERLAATIENSVNASPPEEVCKNFVQWVKDATTANRVTNSTLLITDNATFDLAHLAHFMGSDPLYIFGEYRSVIDVTGVYR